MTALDPVYTLGGQIAETVVRDEGCSHRAAMERALDLLPSSKAPHPTVARRNIRTRCLAAQRAMTALALSCRQSLPLADEPTTALDATVQIQVLILLRRPRKGLGRGVVFVTHDLGVAVQIADRVAVKYAGRIVELGSARDVQLPEPSPIRWACWRPPSTAAARAQLRSKPSPAAHPICGSCRQDAASPPAAAMPRPNAPCRWRCQRTSGRATRRAALRLVS
jgi:ABC-type glutathione transport system ATPase component